MLYARLMEKEHPVKRLLLEGNTLIGRSDNISDDALFKLWRDRLSEKDHKNHEFSGDGGVCFSRLKQYYEKRRLELRIPEADKCFSRKHLMFFLPGENELDAYHFIDLFSSSGTQINGKHLHPGVPRIITHGDILSLPLKKGRPWTDFIFKEVEKVTKYEGLIIANPDGTLAEDNKVGLELKKLLEERAFNVDLKYGSVSKHEVIDKLQRVARTSKSHNYFLFMYYGHGSEGGELIFKDGVISVGNLYDMMNGIKAKKILIFDCCYGGHYLINIPENSAVAVSTKKLDLAYTKKFTRPLIEILRTHKGGMYLEDLIAQVCISAEHELYVRGMEPGVEARLITYFGTDTCEGHRSREAFFDKFKFCGLR